MANIQNFKSFGIHKDVLTPEEAKKNGKKGGLRSVEVRREKKAFKDLFLKLLENPVKDKKHLDVLKKLFPNLNQEEMTIRTLAFAGLYKKMMKGDVQAFIAIRDTIGEKPKDIVENTVKVERDLTMENIKEIKAELREKIEGEVVESIKSIEK